MRYFSYLYPHNQTPSPDMPIFVILCILTALLNVAIHYICKTDYRPEDLEGVKQGRLKIKNQTSYFPETCWCVTGVMAILALCLHSNFGSVVVLLCMAFLVVAIMCFVALFCRDSYYAIAEDGLSFVKHGKLEWSHSWDEIDHARMRVVGTGKSFIVYYDIQTKDGVKHRSLPGAMRRDLKEHVRMDRSADAWCILALVVLLSVAAVLFIFALVNSHTA